MHGVSISQKKLVVTRHHFGSSGLPTWLQIPFLPGLVVSRNAPCFFSMFQATVVLASGCSEIISLPLSSRVGDLKILAQKRFQQGLLRLVTADGRILFDPAQSLLDARLDEKDCLTALAIKGKVTATKKILSSGAFALWCFGGNRIVTWGSADIGGDSSAVQDQLRNVQQVQGAALAFAAILADGSVVTWGRPDCGGDSSAVQDQLRNVQQVQGTTLAFAAILADGSVVTWAVPIVVVIAPQCKTS